MWGRPWALLASGVAAPVGGGLCLFGGTAGPGDSPHATFGMVAKAVRAVFCGHPHSSGRTFCPPALAPVSCPPRSPSSRVSVAGLSTGWRRQPSRRPLGRVGAGPSPAPSLAVLPACAATRGVRRPLSFFLADVHPVGGGTTRSVPRPRELPLGLAQCLRASQASPAIRRRVLTPRTDSHVRALHPRFGSHPFRPAPRVRLL